MTSHGCDWLKIQNAQPHISPLLECGMISLEAQGLQLIDGGKERPRATVPSILHSYLLLLFQ